MRLRLLRRCAPRNDMRALALLKVLKGMPILSAFVLMVRLALGSMFIVSSMGKIAQPYYFLGNVYGFEMIGPGLGLLVAAVLPWLELFVGLCLVGGVFVGGALLASFGMGVLFTVVLGAALWRHLDISCGCFSVTSSKVTYATLIRAVVIMVVSGGAYAATILLEVRRAMAAAPESRADLSTEDGGAQGLLLSHE